MGGKVVVAACRLPSSIEHTTAGEAYRHFWISSNDCRVCDLFPKCFHATDAILNDGSSPFLTTLGLQNVKM